ncbi:hypothetical protein HK103_000779 [Boothiomyces macroporosus]|uniref:RRM domain-containing protein n=1 Tax=Boothiomyces macroporosus TaxID=261099 RepID=A0AAD5Y3H4_9FUNG|nr:hypothetical protein HK103_000779 [Boothiomyces macroporosus]
MGENRRVYFGKLPRDCRERDIEKLAKEFGRIRDVRCLQGFAFVEFDDGRDASDCVKDLDGTRFMGERIICEFAKSSKGDRRDDRRDDRRRDDRRDDRDRPRNIRKPDHRVTVLGLPRGTSWQDLKDLMRKVAEVQYTNVDQNGDGVVEFISIEGKEKALKHFEGYDYNGSILSIKEDDRRERDDRDDRRDRDDRDDRRDRDRDDRRDRDREDDRDRSRSPAKRAESPPKRHDDEE